MSVNDEHPNRMNVDIRSDSIPQFIESVLSQASQLTATWGRYMAYVAVNITIGLIVLLLLKAEGVVAVLALVFLISMALVMPLVAKWLALFD